MKNLQSNMISNGEENLGKDATAKNMVELEISADKLDNDRMSYHLRKSYYEYLYSMKFSNIDSDSDFSTAFIFI